MKIIISQQKAAQMNAEGRRMGKKFLATLAHPLYIPPPDGLYKNHIIHYIVCSISYTAKQSAKMVVAHAKY